MDLDAVRTFVAVADTGQFSEAAFELSITQQAVSKRVAALEKELGVRLFDRVPRGSRLTIDGQAFLPHARGLLHAEQRAAASVRPGHRALRVDVVGRRLAPAGLLRDFHRSHSGTALDVVTLPDGDAALTAVGSGTIDAAFRAVTEQARRHAGVEAVRVFDEPLVAVTGAAHELAGESAVSLADLVGYRIWMPGNVTGTEWSAYYDALAAAFGLTIDPVGPNFGIDPLLDAVAGSPALVTFAGARTPLSWPADHDLRRIPVRGPTPVYPHSLLWRADNPHPALPELREYLGSAERAADTWTPEWARR
ncbi:LysR family transcriptional regulator [Prauserella cavernicola]|uniref:LysR family transcriptional regulator n=1 Tax=Prauserella cavernicola TaxID=2800127 RepID=A0A934QRD9_9PSEU|nr:LysR family transcriptional regulator [Prauserella cavernicola]MBK1784743.1 LysR family transcriptional regulator [Prauserella cavernicola]